MKKICLSILVACFCVNVACAALPPLAQSIVEMEEMIGSQELFEKLNSGEMIENVMSTHNGYCVVTNYSLLLVDVVYIKSEPHWVGPQKFDLVFHDPIPLEK